MSDTPVLHIDINHQYLEEESDPEQDRYMFVYSIVFKNFSQHAIRLKSYHWVLTNSNGEEQEINQDSLSGEQPKIAHQEEFEFTKGILLNTPLGTLHGYFKMSDHQDIEHKLLIPPFRLATSLVIH